MDFKWPPGNAGFILDVATNGYKRMVIPRSYDQPETVFGVENVLR